MASEYIAAYTDIPYDFGIVMEEKGEEAFVTIHYPNITAVPMFIDENTIPKVLANDMLQETYRLVKTYKRNVEEAKNPEITSINSQIKLTEKLIKTAVDKSDARMNQRKKEELQEKLKDYIPADKLARNRLRAEIRACFNSTEKAELEARLAEMKAARDTSNMTSFDRLIKVCHDAAKEVEKARQLLDLEKELKEFKEFREEMQKRAEEEDEGEEEENMMNIMKAASEVADNETEKQEYEEKAQKFEKIKKLKIEKRANMTKERKERKRKERIAKKRAELGVDDSISIPEEELITDDEGSDPDNSSDNQDSDIEGIDEAELIPKTNETPKESDAAAKTGDNEQNSPDNSPQSDAKISETKDTTSSEEDRTNQEL